MNWYPQREPRSSSAAAKNRRFPKDLVRSELANFTLQLSYPNSVAVRGARTKAGVTLRFPPSEQVSFVHASLGAIAVIADDCDE